MKSRCSVLDCADFYLDLRLICETQPLIILRARLRHAYMTGPGHMMYGKCLLSMYTTCLSRYFNALAPDSTMLGAWGPLAFMVGSDDILKQSSSLTQIPINSRWASLSTAYRWAFRCGILCKKVFDCTVLERLVKRKIHFCYVLSSKVDIFSCYKHFILSQIFYVLLVFHILTRVSFH